MEEPFRQLRRELDSLFGTFFDFWPVPTNREGWGLEMEELDKEVVIRAEAPGFEAKDFVIHLTGDVLTIRAEKEVAKGKEGEPEVESRHAFLRRSLTVPPGIDPEKIEAIYRNGVLEVHLPKTPEAVGRRIEVKT
jgi:HSP20 family protein